MKSLLESIIGKRGGGYDYIKSHLSREQYEMITKSIEDVMNCNDPLVISNAGGKSKWKSIFGDQKKWDEMLTACIKEGIDFSNTNVWEFFDTLLDMIADHYDEFVDMFKNSKWDEFTSGLKKISGQ